MIVMRSKLHRGLDDGFVECLAAEGFVVFNPNYRGSDNLGGAFQRGVIGDAGDGPSKDVMAGVEVCVFLGVQLCVWSGQTRIAIGGLPHSNAQLVIVNR
jgi:hypothetical protein